jgi:hypothetical protein
MPQNQSFRHSWQNSSIPQGLPSLQLVAPTPVVSRALPTRPEFPENSQNNGPRFPKKKKGISTLEAEIHPAI